MMLVREVESSHRTVCDDRLTIGVQRDTQNFLRYHVAR
jgi:hypothetical protein